MLTHKSSMHLMYTLDADGKRIYTLKKVQMGEVTKSAHPARFSPDDKYSRFVFAVGLAAIGVAAEVLIRRKLISA